jgi:hypothetical protein
MAYGYDPVHRLTLAAYTSRANDSYEQFWYDLLGNRDGDGDPADYADFEACLLGPGGGLGAGRDCFDLDDSGDVDLADFQAFQQAFGR